MIQVGSKGASKMAKIIAWNFLKIPFDEPIKKKDIFVT